MGAQYSTNHQHKDLSNHTAIDNNVHSDLYVACFDGDSDSVRKILKKSPFENINRREPNGSTSLHVAVERGHVEIVRLLLHEYGVVRHLTDRNGETAFKLAQTEEIRRLFHRPTSDGNRFCGNEKLGVVFSSKQKDDQQALSRRVKPYNRVEEVRLHEYWDIYSQLHNLKNGILYRSLFNRRIQRTKQEQINSLLSIVDECIGSSNIQYAKAKELVQTFSENEQLDWLIRLFTLETPFYRFINERQESSMVFFLLFEKSRESFPGREFKGISYRGLSMTEEDLEMYEWARQAENRYLEVKTFCSSTGDEEYARFYAEANENNQRKPVLMIFEFSQICNTAIRLAKISNELPSLSNFEDEEEILILPGTVFSVKQIVKIQSLTTIYLAHLNLDEERWKYADIMIDKRVDFT